MNTQEIETAARHFVIAAIWADGPEGRKIKSAPETDAIARVFVEEFAQAWPSECAQVMAKDGYGLHPDAGTPAAAFGHDLYLTCAGHGAGFWDRPELGESGRRISERIRAEWRRWSIESYPYRRRLYFCVSPEMRKLAGQAA
ncbi:hypothetical protein HDG34_003196 [Paraburkholderia sp. HC6.4b]|uniref:hypothetical protein n=1 Tax=unclassified Paraburkholderia TaxID=2615204 RepID=UPI0016103974|nr:MULTISPECIES: hypothetical protein [unclassified Paraburkholderia]MBB5409255.1 hypothetical protein [Paraburkholderia sp. HC6.4b]MBB5450983.1 hypothetical protein [Paraburkholderia sp. Kb1A]